MLTDRIRGAKPVKAEPPTAEALQASAEAMAHLGFRVYPVRYPITEVKSSKGAVCDDWVNAASTDPEWIELWWGQNTRRNVGYLPGPDVLALDVDVGPGHKNGNGLETLEALEKELGELPETLTAVTGTGGFHLLYSWKRHGIGAKNSWHPGIDLHGTTGGMVAPGSWRQDTGTEYSWLFSPADHELAELPEAWKNKIREECKPKYTPKTPAGKYPDEPLETAIEALNSIPVTAVSSDDWLRIGMACCRGWGDAMLAPFQQWSMPDPRYHAEEWPGKWESFRKEGTGTPVTAATLFWFAKEYGWKPEPRYTLQGGEDHPESMAPVLNPWNLHPFSLTAMGEATLFADLHRRCARYCSEMKDWLVYDGARWSASTENAGNLMKVMIRAQYELAIERAKQTAGETVAAQAEAQAHPDNEDLQKAKARAEAEEAKAKAYSAFVVKTCMKPHAVGSLLDDARFDYPVSAGKLDQNGSILVTPAGTCSLVTGECRENMPEDFSTKCTAVSPSEQGADIWQDFLLKLCGGDAEKVKYLQCVCGMTAWGRVYEEKLVVCIGPGGNGKSTFWGAVCRVLGDYAGTVPAEVLTTTFKGNTEYVYASLRGKRLILAAELEEGKKMNTGVMKILTSRDKIDSREIREKHFSFYPTHTAVLYTNNLPRVDAQDTGTWDRLVLVPLTERFRGTAGEIKDYDSYLVNSCGGAILQWIIDGAVMFYENGGRLPYCQAVEDATAKYREDNDIIANFLQNSCDYNPDDQTLQAMGGDLYAAYTDYCTKNGITARIRSNEFANLLKSKFRLTSRRGNRGIVYTGVSLRREAQDELPY